jgi:hypothetical protein
MPALAVRPRAAIALAAILDYRDWASEADITADTGMGRDAMVRASNVLIDEGIRVLCDGQRWRLSKHSWADAKAYARGK